MSSNSCRHSIEGWLHKKAEGRLSPEEAVALEEAGNLEESLSKWKEIRAVKDTPNAALRHGCLARELKKWDEAELAGLPGMQLDRAASFGLTTGTL